MKIKKIILSRGRHGSITSDTLFPNATLVVPKSEIKEYKKTTNNEIHGISDNIMGLGNVRNYCLYTFKEDCLVMIDDDIQKLWVMTRLHGYAITDPTAIEHIVDNTAEMAQQLNTSLITRQKWHSN